MDKSLYNLQFKLASGKDPSVFVNIQREMTAEEAEKLKSATGKSVAAPADKKKSDLEDLYIIVYKGYKNYKIQKIVRFILLDKFDLEKLNKKAVGLESDDFTVEQASIDDIYSLLKGEVIKGVGKARKTTLYDMTSKIEDIIARKKEKKKTKEPSQTKKADAEDILDTDFAAEDRKEAAKFTTSDNADKFYNRIVTAYNNYTNPNSPSFKKPIAKEKLQDAFDDYFNLLGEFTEDLYVMAAVLDLIEPKLRDKKELFNMFVNNFDKIARTEYDMKENKVKEMSTTGTGATATPGEGEGMATKYAFAGAGASPKKKKKLKEDLTPDEELFKAEAIYDLIKNTVMNMTVKKALADLPKVKQFYSNLEKSSGAIGTLADNYEDSNPSLSKKFSDISNNIIKLDNILADLISIYEKAQTNPVK